VESYIFTSCEFVLLWVYGYLNLIVYQILPIVGAGFSIIGSCSFFIGLTDFARHKKAFLLSKKSFLREKYTQE